MRQPPEVDSPIPRAMFRSPRRLRRKKGTLGVLLLGRILSTPVSAIAVMLVAFVVLEPVVVFILPARPARILRQWCQFKARRGMEFYVEYQLDRSGFIGRDEVLPQEYSALAVGQVVRAHVIHLGHMGYSALDRSLGDYARDRGLVWVNAAFALTVGGMLYYATWLLPRRSRWLVQHGTPTFGAIVDKGYLGGRRHISFRLTYQFKSLGTLRARRICISPQRYDFVGVKDLVIILFDPSRPSRNIIYDYCDFIIF